MGKYAAYPAYKESGVEWLGEIPEHWKAIRFKFLVSEPFKYGANEVAEFSDPDQPRYIRITDVREDGTLRDETYRSLPEEVARDYLLQTGDILLARSGATVGKTFIYDTTWGRAAFAGYLIRARLSNKVDSKFIYHYLQSSIYWQWVSSIFIQATIQNISAEKYANLWLSLPPLPEQEAIARFLDHKTAQIDSLIARKEALLARLADKRTALISQAVTRGLDPTVPMKDSGIEWLGEIPAHWETVRFTHFVDFKEGPGIMAADFQENGVPLLRITNLKPGYVDLEGCNYLDPEKVKSKWEHFKLVENDLLISSSASTGLVSLVDDVSAGSIPYTGIIRLRPANDQIEREYIEVFVGSEIFFVQIDLLKTGTTIQHYGPIHLRQMKMPLPPVQEQEQISSYVVSVNQEIDSLSAQVQSAINKLKQYRTALITNAVTGKIDVREAGLWAIESPASS